MEMPEYDSSDAHKKKYIEDAIKDPEAELLVIPTISGVKFAGDFGYAVMAQPPIILQHGSLSRFSTS